MARAEALFPNSGRSFTLLVPIVSRLLQAGECALLQSFLAAWQGVAADERRRPTSCLVVNLSHPAGALYAVDGRPAMLGTGTVEQLSSVIKTQGEFLGAPFVLTGTPHFTPTPPPREVGVPNRARATELDAELTAWLDPARLRAIMRSSPDALLVVPGSQLPVQALVHRETGRLLPLVVSMQKPAAERRIRRALLWVTGSIHAEAEATAVLELLKNADVVVNVIPEARMSKATFVAEYTSAKYDLLWISSHNTYDHYSPHRTELLLRPGESISMDELLALEPPIGDRRLLVLNTCDGGTAATLDGLGEFGVGPALCCSAQAVISHAWPVDTFTATVFGILLAVGFIERRSFVEGFAFAQRILLEGRDAACREMARMCGEDCEALKRLQKREGALSSLADWASAVFLE